MASITRLLSCTECLFWKTLPLMPPNSWNSWPLLSMPSPSMSTDLERTLSITLQAPDPPYRQQCVSRHDCIWSLPQMECPTDLTFSHIPHDLQILCNAQERLGWKQLYYGHTIRPFWIMLLGCYHPQVNWLIYFAKVVMLIWQAILNIWKLQNKHLHLGIPEQEECNQHQAAVIGIFFKGRQDPILQKMVKTSSPSKSWTDLHDGLDNGPLTATTTCRLT